MTATIVSGRPHKGFELKVLCFKQFESGRSVEEVKRAFPDAAETLVYEAYRAFNIAKASKKVNDPSNANARANSDTPEEVPTDQVDITSPDKNSEGN